MNCPKCSEPAIWKLGTWHCPKHYRFNQIRISAKRYGKAVPSHESLESFVAHSMNCPDCGVQMNWLRVDGQATVATLQHYRDGSMAIVCMSCNSRHKDMPGDTYREMPKDHKLCPQCKAIKPRTEYYRDNAVSGNLKSVSWCKTCRDKSVDKWRANNPTYMATYMRQWRAKRKAQGAI